MYALTHAPAITYRRRKGVKRLTLRFKAATRSFVVTAPWHVSKKEVEQFVQRKADWMQALLKESPAILRFADGASIPVLGNEVRLIKTNAIRGLTYRERDNLYIAGSVQSLSRRVTDWLKAYVRQEMQVIAYAKAAQLGETIRHIQVRDTTSRWGSCTSGGNLSFSWRLVFAPREIMEYVVCHEVAHLVEMNHSPAFWQVVEQLCPDWRNAELWLKKHGVTLYRWG